MTLICSTGMETDLDDLEKRIKQKVDYHEIRMELYSGKEKKVLQLTRDKKIIFTFSFFQNQFPDYFSANQHIFKEIAQYSDFYCDIDYKFLIDRSNFNKLTSIIPVSRIIASAHFYQCKSMALIFEVVGKINEIACGGGKLAVKIDNYDQLFKLRKIKFEQKIRAVIAMGKIGRISRFKPSFFNGNLTYGYALAQFKSAPEQPSLSSLERGRIYGESELEVLALAGGHLVYQSPSYQFYNSLFSKLDLNYHYLKIQLFDEYELEALMNFPFKGLSVTMPLKKSRFLFTKKKEKLAGLKKKLHGSAAITKAVNTVVFKRCQGIVHLLNTDYLAFDKIFNSQLKIQNCFEKNALILGNGAAAQSCIAALPSDYSLLIGCRNRVRAISQLDFLLKKRKNKIISLEKLEKLKPTVVINTLPVNLTFQNWKKILAHHKPRLVIDLLMENRAQTNLIKIFSETGTKVIDGYDFWLQQGLHQLSSFFSNTEFYQIKNVLQ